MRTMIDLGKERGPMGMHMITTATTVDCGSREVGLRRSLRFMLDCLVPACCAAGFEPPAAKVSPDSSSSSSSSAFSSDTESPSSSPSTNRLLPSSATTIKGTFFGQRNGRVSLCLQDDNHHRRTPSRRTPPTTATSSPTFSHPLLLLELAVPTSSLAKEMQHGLLRIALVEEDRADRHQITSGGGIFEVPIWSMYCNGRKVGYATRRKMTAADSAALTRMQSVSAGAGVLPPENNNNSTDGIMYLRASFRRITGSRNSESFHMINPGNDGRPSYNNNNNGSGQELSIFLLRSSS
ncbi:protein MIZU-KUSSEI 1-like [Bidens hawaiensis]|uniref:protein MIZU-KUSSEI 1-like n=1 Tax=Bidens hawaiensis TaxID=980011 RepID=UPI004049F35B